MISHVERAVALSMAAAIASLTAPARADITRAQCIAANGQAQSLRRDGKLGEARDLLRSCSDPKCPNTVATDCTRRLDELESAQPTIVFDVKDGSGADLQAVKVTVDDRPLADKIDGTAFQIDPGDHAFTFEVDGQAPVTQRFVLTEGQKGRHESIVIGPPPAPAVVAAPSPAAPEPETVEPPPSGLGTQKKIAIGLGAAGVAGVAAGAVFGILASSSWHAQQRDCASSTDCPDHDQAVSDHHTLTTDGTVSTVAFIAGGALLAAGATLFFIKRHEPAAPPDSVSVSLGVGPMTTLRLTGEF